ncbi:MAG: 30S ribosomal protein S20 [Desulfonatronovibrionaceae bacterium]
MANHRSAFKRHKQSLKANVRNKAIKTRIKNAVKKVDQAVAQNDAQQAHDALRTASSILDRAAQKKVIHKRKAARKISRLNKAINNIAS